MNPENSDETGELRRKQAKRQREEADQAARTEPAAERRQHARRADKAAYLEEKLAERERAERDAG